MKMEGWASLLPLADAVRLAAETRLAKALHAEATLTEALDRLDQSAGAGTEDEAMRRTGADLRWERWCAARRGALLTDLAQLRYRRMVAEEAMRHAAARALATAELARNERTRLAHLRASRAEREGDHAAPVDTDSPAPSGDGHIH
jgi:hypothetical protein